MDWIVNVVQLHGIAVAIILLHFLTTTNLLISLGILYGPKKKIHIVIKGFL